MQQSRAERLLGTCSASLPLRLQCRRAFAKRLQTCGTIQFAHPPRLPPHPSALALQYPTRANVMQQLMYRLGMAERIHLGASAGQQRGVEELALAGGLVLLAGWWC